MEDLLAALGANALILGALTYLVKSFIGLRLEKDVIEFKSDIKRKASEEMERFRAQLEKDRLRIQISYGGIFERQADAILELYGAVVALERGVNEAIKLGVGNIQERRMKLENPLQELNKTFIDKQILLPPVVENAIMAFLAKLPSATLTYILEDTRDFSSLSAFQADKAVERQQKALEIILKEVPQLRGTLIAEMRKVIGVVASEF